MNKTAVKLYFLFLFTVMFGFAAHTVMIGSQFVSQGSEIAKLEKQSRTLSSQTQALQHQIAENSSASGLTELAASAGFVPATQIIALQTGFVASR